MLATSKHSKAWVVPSGTAENWHNCRMYQAPGPQSYLWGTQSSGLSPSFLLCAWHQHLQAHSSSARLDDIPNLNSNTYRHLIISVKSFPSILGFLPFLTWKQDSSELHLSGLCFSETARPVWKIPKPQIHIWVDFAGSGGVLQRPLGREKGAWPRLLVWLVPGVAVERLAALLAWLCLRSTKEPAHN